MSEDMTGITKDRKCPMCKSGSRVTWLDEGKPTRYVRCTSCSTVYASPCAPASVRFSWLNATFDYGENSIKNALARRSTLHSETALIKRHAAGGRMLDIGCSLGDFFSGFPDPGWQRYGVELSPSAAAFAADAHAAKVYAGTLLNAAYPSGFFDLVTLIDTMYYLDDPESDFREIHRIMKRGGALAVEIPGQAFILWRGRGPICWLIERRWNRLRPDSAYILWPTPAALEGFLKGIGFRVENWHVLPSPEQSSRLQRIASRAYYVLCAFSARVIPSLLTLAPRYLCVAIKT